MAHKKTTTKLLGIAAIALAIVFSFAGCDNPAASDGNTSETWAKVTSWDQLNGTWKGSYSGNMTGEDFVRNKTSLTWDTAKSTLGENLKAAMSITDTITIDTAAKTHAESSTTTATLSDVNGSSGWNAIKTALENYFNANLSYYSNVTFNETAHTVTYTYSFGTSPITGDVDSFFPGAVEINNSGTKFKLLAGSNYPEITYTKQ
jgi:flagellar basal body L-ring protein FlgH